MTINKIVKDYKEYIESMNNMDLVIIDPPWNYNNQHKQFTSKTVFNKVYDNVEFLNYMFQNVKSKVILLWITSPLMGYFFDKKFNINFRDYSFKQILTWAKTTNNGELYKGSGFWFKNTCEYLILFVNNTAKCINSRVLSFTIEKAIKNSETQKPKEFESSILREFYNASYKNCAYIFSGNFLNYDISSKQNLDLIDIKQNEITK